MSKAAGLPPRSNIFSRRVRITFALLVTALLGGPLYADIIWSSGTNTVSADTILQDSHILITGGTNTVQGASGPPGGTNAGILQLNSGGTGLELTGGVINLNSDAVKAGTFLLKGNVTSHASAISSAITNGGAGAVAGTLSLNGGTRTFTVESSSIPGNGPDLGISASIANGGLTKLGPGRLSLSGASTYSGGTMLAAGKLDVNSATALGSGDLTISAVGTSIDNTSLAAITLSSNNQINLSGGDLNFVGTNDLNFGSGFFTITGASTRTITVVNATASLTIGGTIGDNGEHVGLVKSGPGALILSGENLYTSNTTVSAGTLALAGSTIDGFSVGTNGTFIQNGTVGGDVSISGNMTGMGTINGSLVVNNGGIVDLTGGTLTVQGGVTNNGLFILSNGAQISGVTGFVNNGTLDLTTAGSFNPPNFTNNGTIIDASVVKTKSISKAGNKVTVTIDAYTGHKYQLQKSSSPAFASFSLVDNPKSASTGTVLSLVDNSATETSAFYRVVVNP